MFNKIVIMIGTLVLSLLVGCSNEKDASGSNKNDDINLKQQNCRYCTEIEHKDDCPAINEGIYLLENNDAVCRECGESYITSEHLDFCSLYLDEGWNDLGDGSENQEECLECGEFGTHLDYCPTLIGTQVYTGTTVDIQRAKDSYFKVDTNTVPNTIDPSIMVYHYANEVDRILLDEIQNKNFKRNEQQYLELVKTVCNYMDNHLKELGCPPLGINIFYQLVHGDSHTEFEKKSVRHYTKLIDVSEPTNNLEKIIYEFMDNTSYDNRHEISKILVQNGYPDYLGGLNTGSILFYRTRAINK